MGYEEKKWWVSPRGDDEGWRWVTYRNAKHPSFWVATSHPEMAKFIGGKPDHPYQKDDGHVRAGDGPEFKLRVELDIIDMPWDWPVEVNYHEARAFLNWKSAKEGSGRRYRMPTEAEWHLMRDDPSPFPEATTGKRSLAAGRARLGAGEESKKEETDSILASETALLDGEAPVAGPREFGVASLPPSRGGDFDKDEAARLDRIMQRECPGNTNLRFHSPSPVNLFPPSPAGFYDTHGNVWEWCEDHFSALPGFEVHPLYDDFSTPCFSPAHERLIGGSWVSTGNQCSNFARYAFRRHFFQHVGFRYVVVQEEEEYPGFRTAQNFWASQGSLARDVVDNYVAPKDRLHFPRSVVGMLGDDAFGYNVRLAEIVLGAVGGDASGKRVLHLGSGVGGGTLELARHFERVVGVEKEEILLRFSRLIQHHGEREFDRITEGALSRNELVFAPKGIDRNRMHYVHADACDLPLSVFGPEEEVAKPSDRPFDVVVVDSLLTRLVQPLDLVSKLADMVRSGGVLVISSSNDWNPDITPRNSWLGGFAMNGEEYTTKDMLLYNLKANFELQAEADVCKISSHHDRKHVIDIMQVTTWLKK